MGTVAKGTAAVEPLATVAGARTTALVSMIVPAYNEAGNIRAVVEEAMTVLGVVSSRFEVLVGNDGSTDGTREILDALAGAHSNVHVFHADENRGVAQNCLDLYRRARGDLIALFPGDGQVRPVEVVRLLGARSRFDVVVGRRKPRRDPAGRKAAAWIWSAACRVLFGLPVWDVDSVKLFPGEFLRSVRLESRSPFVETELLVRARAQGLRVGNVDVEHFPRIAGTNTGGRRGIVLSAIGELLRFWFRWSVQGGRKR